MTHKLQPEKSAAELSRAPCAKLLELSSSHMHSSALQIQLQPVTRATSFISCRNVVCAMVRAG